jgi:Ca2+-binding EF-hand superfamily protein
MDWQNQDPKARAARMFDFTAQGKDYVSVADLEAQAVRRGDTTAHDKLQSFLQASGITNGQLNRDQFAAYMEQRMAERQATAGMRPQWTGNRDDARAEMEFRQLDKNGDGQLDASEMTAELRAEVTKWDTNKDGLINLEEYKAYYKARMEFLRNENGDNNSPGANWIAGQPGQPGETEQPEIKRTTVYHIGNMPKDLPPWFLQYDTDKDGQIGLYEWKAAGKPLEEFRQMDLNNDGFLTVEEVMHHQRVLAKKNGQGQGTASTGDLVQTFPGFPGPGGPGFPGGPGMTIPGFPGGIQWNPGSFNPPNRPGRGGPGGPGGGDRGGRPDRGGPPGGGDNGGRPGRGGGPRGGDQGGIKIQPGTPIVVTPGE